MSSQTMNLYTAMPEMHYKLYIRLQNYHQVVVFFFSRCVASWNTIKLLSGSDRGNQKSLVLQNVINVPGCLEIYETNAINHLAAGTAVARHHFSPSLPPSYPSSLPSFPLSTHLALPVPQIHLGPLFCFNIIG